MLSAEFFYGLWSVGTWYEKFEFCGYQGQAS